MKKLTEFGELFRTLRIRTGISEEDIGRKVGKSQGYISVIENKEMPLLTFDFVKACIDAFELKEDERHLFLVKAMLCSEKMIIPLDSISIVPKERFLQILAYMLLNYKPQHSPSKSWIHKCFNAMCDNPPYKIV
jgi:transcriptional regulator with XRE-family HTH domain